MGGVALGRVRFVSDDHCRLVETGVVLVRRVRVINRPDPSAAVEISESTSIADLRRFGVPSQFLFPAVRASRRGIRMRTLMNTERVWLEPGMWVVHVGAGHSILSAEAFHMFYEITPEGSDG